MTTWSLAVALAGLVVGAGAQHDPKTVERKLFGNALDIDDGVDGVSHRQLSPLVLRGLAEIVTEFPQCQHKSVQDCKDLVAAEYGRNPARFGGPGQTFTYDVRTKRLRGDYNYNWVTIVPDETGTLAAGPYGDGMQYYFTFWRIDGNRVALGPWDCTNEDGSLMTTAECCGKVLRSEVRMDDRGNYLECHVQPMARADPNENTIVIVENPHRGEVVHRGADIYR
jgi:hypothetical protein